MDILHGTHNKRKIAFYNSCIDNSLPGIHFRTLDEFNAIEDVEETGQTFEANALLKARYYGNSIGLPTVSTDGGLEIDALNGEPGVKTRRWIGRRMTDAEMVDLIFERLNDVPWKERTASFTVVFAFYDPILKYEHIIKKSSHGMIITEKPELIKIPGFPVRSLFYINQFDRVLQDLTEDELESIDHNKMAIIELIKFLKETYVR